MTATKTTKSTTQESEIEKLQASLAALALELRNTRQDLVKQASTQQLPVSKRRNLSSKPPGMFLPTLKAHSRQRDKTKYCEYKLFMRQRRAVKRTLDRFKARNPDLDAVEMEELRFERSPRGQFVYQYMLDDKNAPIEFSRYHSFALKEKKTEEEMIEYITRIYNTNTQ
ncbi:hypothetical protein BGZ54_001624 [Gamsiella multidivaricata]|nr:hypothetical protein BGZ54_001624 [Gamsiella multidivaricata]